jgi:hypothetical protein
MVSPYRKDVLSIIREVHKDDSDEIAGALQSLSDDGAIPDFKELKYSHRLFVLDPRAVRSDVKKNFSLGYGAFKAKIEADPKCDLYDIKSANIGNITLRAAQNGPRNLLFAELDCPEVAAERVAYYGYLQRSGIANLQRRMEKPGSLDVFLGKFDPKVLSPDQTIYSSEAVEEAIQDTFAVLKIGEISLMDSIIPEPNRRSSD